MLSEIISKMAITSKRVKLINYIVKVFGAKKEPTENVVKQPTKIKTVKDNRIFTQSLIHWITSVNPDDASKGRVASINRGLVKLGYLEKNSSGIHVSTLKAKRAGLCYYVSKPPQWTVKILDVTFPCGNTVRYYATHP